MLSNGDRTHAPGSKASETHSGEPGAGSAASASALGNRSRDACKRAEQPRFSVDLKMPAFHPKREVPTPRDTADFPSLSDQTFPEGDPQLSSESPARHPKDKLPDLHTKEHAGGGRRGPAADLTLWTSVTGRPGMTPAVRSWPPPCRPRWPSTRALTAATRRTTPRSCGCTNVSGTRSAAAP